MRDAAAAARRRSRRSSTRCAASAPRRRGSRRRRGAGGARSSSEQLAETRRLTDEFSRAQAALEGQLADALERLRQLQLTYEQRPPRDEDLQLIEQLKRAVREKDEIVRRTYEELKYFKLELQNREENFNKNFGGGPRVGVSDGRAQGRRRRRRRRRRRTQGRGRASAR